MVLMLVGLGGGLVWVGSLFDQERWVGIVVAPVLLFIGFGLLGEGLREILPEHLRSEPEPESEPQVSEREKTVFAAVLAAILLVLGIALLLVTFTPTVLGIEPRSISDVVGLTTSFFGFLLTALGIALVVQVVRRALGLPARFFDDDW